MQWRRSSSKRVGFFHGARSAGSRKMKVADISSALRTSPASWRAVPCPTKRPHVREGWLRSAIRVDLAIRDPASANQQIAEAARSPDGETSQENGIAIPAAVALLDQGRHELTAEA